MKDEFDGFSVQIIEETEGEYLAHLIELPNVSAFGDTVENAIAELKIAWHAMKASYRKHKEKIPVAPLRKKYSGQFNIRIDKRIHRALVIEATLAGISLNALVSQKLTQSV